MKFEELIKNKKVLFITTKNIDYIRNTQELRILKNNASEVEVVCSGGKNYAIRIIDVWRKISRRKVKECDVVFIGFEPQFVLPYFGCFFKDKLVCIDFFVSVYDTLILDRKKFKDGSLFAKYFHHIDRKTIQLANHVVTDTKAHKDYFIEEFSADKNKFETIYLEADSDIYFPRQQTKPLPLQDKFVVFYFGSMLPLQGVDVILDAIRELGNKEDIYFDIIGPVPSKYNKPIQDNVHYSEWLSQEELAEHIASADLCLAGHFNADIAKARRTIAGKTYIYEMMNKIMILGDCEANRELFKEDVNHRFVNMSSPQDLKMRILETKEVWTRERLHESQIEVQTW